MVSPAVAHTLGNPERVTLTLVKLPEGQHATFQPLGRHEPVSADDLNGFLTRQNFEVAVILSCADRGGHTTQCKDTTTLTCHARSVCQRMCTYVTGMELTSLKPDELIRALQAAVLSDPSIVSMQ